MYRNPPFNFMCRTCRPYAYFRTYENLRAHFRAVHRLRQLPPAADNYYIAPLGLNGPDGPISGRNLLHDESSNGASTSDGTRQFQSSNDESIPGTSHDIGGHRKVHVQLPISGDQLQQAITEAVKASLNEEIEKRLPLLAAEINSKIAAAMDNKLPTMVSDILMEAANRIEANTVEIGTEANPVVVESEAKPSTSSTIAEGMDICASTDQKRDEDGTEFNPELMQSTAISIESVNCVVETDAGIDSATAINNDVPIQHQSGGMEENLISDDAGTDKNPESSMNNESLSTQSKRLCEEADALIKELCAPDDKPKKDDDHTESDEELMAVVEPLVGSIGGSELAETQFVASKEHPWISPQLNAESINEGDGAVNLGVSLAEGVNECDTAMEVVDENKPGEIASAADEQVSLESIRGMFDDSSEVPRLIFPASLDDDSSVIDLVTPDQSPKPN